jgi:hypothetical protein
MRLCAAVPQYSHGRTRSAAPVPQQGTGAGVIARRSGLSRQIVDRLSFQPAIRIVA